MFLPIHLRNHIVFFDACMNLCLYQRILTCKNTCCTVLRFGSCALVFLFTWPLSSIKTQSVRSKKTTNKSVQTYSSHRIKLCPDQTKKNSSLPVLQLLVLGVLQQHRCQWLNGVSLGGTSPVIIWYPTWLWLTVCHGFSMALIEIEWNRW